MKKDILEYDCPASMCGVHNLIIFTMMKHALICCSTHGSCSNYCFLLQHVYNSITKLHTKASKISISYLSALNIWRN